jgi:carboxyl-terminal processing protease
MKMREGLMRKFPLAIAVLLIMVLGPVTAKTDDGLSSDTYKSLDLFGEVFEQVRHYYVEPVDDKKLIDAAINGMLTSLDPHSSFLDPHDYKDLQDTTTGEFGGLGIEVTQENGVIKIVSPIDDTPGAKAGLKPGDDIVALDGKPVMNMSLEDAVGAMRGLPDTKVKLTIRRGNLPLFDVTLTRAIIHLTSAKGLLMRGDIAYLRVSGFSSHTGEEMRDAYAKLSSQTGGHLSGVVLDLRNNPGGLLEAAIEVSSAFIDHGEVVSTRGRNPQDVQRFDVEPPRDMTHGLPIVVLINGGTASAAEIVSGALQDHHRAVIMGSRSFGKGSVQTIIPLRGEVGAIRITTARYYTPSGRSIQDKGIVPDIAVDPANIEPIAEQPTIHESDLKGALKNTGPDTGSTAAAPVPAASGGDAKPSGGKEGDIEAAAAKDYQLTRALDLLKGLALFSGKSGD